MGMADTAANAFCPECHCPGSFLHYPGCPRYLRDVAASSVVRLNDRDALLTQVADRDRRIEALTKALRALTGCTKEVTNALKACAMFTITDQAARQIALKMVKEGEEAADTANALLASAAGAEDTNTPKGIQP